LSRWAVDPETMEIAAKRIRPISRATSWLPRDLRFRRTEPVLTLGGMRRLILAVIILVAGHRGYRLLTSGAATIDVGVGRRVRRLGPRNWDIAAGRELVFDVIAGPYLAGRRERSRTSSRSGSVARTWSSRRTSRPWSRWRPESTWTG
jgi:hypothetical protein